MANYVIRNQQVVGSSPMGGSIKIKRVTVPTVTLLRFNFRI